MIIIPRRQNESVVIGEDIVLTVLEIRGTTVRLGIEHPRGVTVDRGETVAGVDTAAHESTPPR
jgi:carbon storage regulator